MKKIARAFLASLAVGATCLAAGSVAARGGGGGHGGGGHFGGGGFGGAGHFSGGGHFLGGGHFDGVDHLGVAGLHPGSGASGGAHMVSIGRVAPAHLTQPGFAHPVMGAASTRVHSLEVGRREFTRNAFGDRSGWQHWSDHNGGDWHRWHGWYGPVFWPFLYGDILSFSLFPYDGYDPFWAYDSDAFLSTIYSPAPYGSNVTQALQGDTTVPPDASAACGALAPDVADLPIEQIRQAVHPNATQNAYLDNLRSATFSAKAVIDGECPREVPVTPVDRLAAMQQRLDAMFRAVEIVRGPLQVFYDSLSEGQKASLAQVPAPGMVTARPADSLAALCIPSASGFAELPMDDIERATQPTEQQEGAFEALRIASTNVASQLAASCPATAAQTPVERMDAVAARLTAMSNAAEALRPALRAFYAELTPAQKARFDGPASSVNAAGL